jgi:hypothetical protein
MLSVTVLSVVMPSVIKLSVVMLSVVMPSGIMLSVAMPSVVLIILTNVMQGFVMLHCPIDTTFNVILYPWISMPVLILYKFNIFNTI